MNLFQRVATATVACLAFSSAQAGFIVEQYTEFFSSDLTALQNFAANNDAQFTVEVDVVDFTDDPNGFAGDIPGSSPWPAAQAAGVTGTGGVNDTFFARITTQFTVQTADTFTFRTFNDDGVFLLVDEILVINDPFFHPESVNTGSIALTAGVHDIELFFFENGGEASLEFSVADGSGVFDLVEGEVAAVSAPATALLLMAGLGLVARRRV